MRGAAFLVVVRGMAVVICRNGDIDVKNPAKRFNGLSSIVPLTESPQIPPLILSRIIAKL